jgi:hypothetical protein
VTRPTVDLAGATWALYALRILIVFALADISLRWIELPIRSGAVESWFRGMKYRTKKVRIRQKSSVLAGLLALIIATSFVSANALGYDSRQREALRTSLTPPATQIQIPNPVKPTLWLTGDSVILGIRFDLSQHVPIGLVNARVGRQAGELITVLHHDKVAMANSPVVLDLGNNNRLTPDEVEAVFEEIKNQPQIILVNTAVPRPWRDANDALIAKYAKQYPQTSVIDWREISHGHPEYFGPDGVHLVPDGITAYVDAILSVLNTEAIK